MFSQVILSLQLSFAVVPLVLFTSDRRKMGEFCKSGLDENPRVDHRLDYRWLNVKYLLDFDSALTEVLCEPVLVTCTQNPRRPGKQPADESLLPHVAELARRLGSELLLIHVADGWAARNFDQLKLAESEEMKSRPRVS